MAKVEIKIHYDSEWEEYQVQWIENGELNEAKTYHTDDKQDAIATKAQIEKELSVQQHQRLDQTGDRLNIPKLQ